MPNTVEINNREGSGAAPSIILSPNTKLTMGVGILGAIIYVTFQWGKKIQSWEHEVATWGGYIEKIETMEVRIANLEKVSSLQGSKGFSPPATIYESLNAEAALLPEQVEEFSAAVNSPAEDR